jgi:hypothetical protein
MRGEGTCAVVSCRIAAFSESPKCTREFNHKGAQTGFVTDYQRVPLTKVTAKSQLFAYSGAVNSYY